MRRGVNTSLVEMNNPDRWLRYSIPSMMNSRKQQNHPGKPTHKLPMTHPLPKWIMQRYSTLWNRFGEREFSYDEASRSLNETNAVSVLLSGLKRAGWLETRLNPKDSRKRIYKLKSPEQAVREMQTLP